jgi:hypothetical protein
MVYLVTAVHLEGGERHEHIGRVRWESAVSNETGESSCEEMVEYIDGGGHVFVSQGENAAQVGVVHADPPYIRTYADGVWNDNLLALPTY